MNTKKFFKYVATLNKNLADSKLVQGLVFLILNIGIKYASIELSKSQKKYIKAALWRELVVFILIWSSTKDLIISLLLTVVFVIFTDYLFNELNKRDDLIIVLLGKKAEQYEMRLMNNTILKVAHPASAAYKGGKWDSKNLFIKVNDLLKEQGNNLITW